MVSIETKGGKKMYETVAERVKKFRATYPVDTGWQLLTEIEFPSDGLVLCRARIVDPAGRVIATGTAEEVRGSSMINKTSAVENAETSAIGRALFAAGFGGGEFCSADELMAALKRQEELMAAEDRFRRAPKTASAALEGQARAAQAAVGKESDLPPAPLVEDEGRRALSPESFGLAEESGIEFLQEGSLLIARDRKKGATFSNREVLKNAGFSFDGHQRVWFKRIMEETTAEGHAVS